MGALIKYGIEDKIIIQISNNRVRIVIAASQKINLNVCTDKWI